MVYARKKGRLMLSSRDNDYHGKKYTQARSSRHKRENKPTFKRNDSCFVVLLFRLFSMIIDKYL